MGLFEGVGPRVIQRMKALGYVQQNGRPDVSRFSKDFGFDKVYVHRWVNDAMTPHKELDKLVEILQCSKGWLIFGEGPAPKPPKKLVPIIGGSATADAPPVGDAARSTLGNASYRTFVQRIIQAVVWPLVPRPEIAYA